MLNYSELSAKNVSINGVQIEYNPSAYMAVAAGTVDYRFRDYSVQPSGSGQWLALLRYGWGKKNGNNVIFTYYTGKRQLYNDNTTLQGTTIPNYSLMGFTVEASYKLTKTTVLTAEAAKSSRPYYSLDSTQPHDVLGPAIKLDDRSNEAYSVKIRSFVPFSQTQVSGTYSRFGSNFQSFSLFTTGSEQSAWSVRVDQPLLQKHLLITGSVKTNDFTNPLLSTAYKSTAVFASIQATLRLKNWPTLFFGYFPSTQIVKLNASEYQENLFYMMTATASESFKVKNSDAVEHADVYAVLQQGNGYGLYLFQHPEPAAQSDGDHRQAGGAAAGVGRRQCLLDALCGGRQGRLPVIFLAVAGRGDKVQRSDGI